MANFHFKTTMWKDPSINAAAHAFSNNDHHGQDLPTNKSTKNSLMRVCFVLPLTQFFKTADDI